MHYEKCFNFILLTIASILFKGNSALKKTNADQSALVMGTFTLQVSKRENVKIHEKLKDVWCIIN